MLWKFGCYAYTRSLTVDQIWTHCRQTLAWLLIPCPPQARMSIGWKLWEFVRKSLQRCHNEHDGVISILLRLDCLLNCLIRQGSKKTSKLCITDLCERNNPLVTAGFPSQRASDVENIFICWCLHVECVMMALQLCFLWWYNKPGPLYTKKMPSWYRDSHYKPEMVVRCLRFIMGNFYTLKTAS